MKPKLLIATALVTAISVFAVYFLFLLDRTPPDAPVLVSPSNGAIIKRVPNINFLDLLWYEPELECTYDLQIATDAQFTNVVLSKTKLPPASYAIGETETLADGTYYWRVRATDKAGNVGPWSEVKMFVVETLS